MVRITKVTDYAIVLLTYFARGPQPRAYSARDLADEAGLPLPTVTKILKGLARDGLLVSHRGTHGGYQLARDPRDISIADIIQALEGPVAITECGEREGLCSFEPQCPLRDNWTTINLKIRDALRGIMLSEMRPQKPLFGIGRARTHKGATR